EEEKKILNNFPKDKQTTETALLFLQLIMRKLRRKKANKRGGRAAIVVPNGTLFADGISAKIKKELLEQFNLHTIIRLGEGAFAPYTDIPANLLFFEHGTPTEKIWFYEMPVPDDRKKYSKTRPMQNVEFDPLKTWWNKRKETENAWVVPINKIIGERENGGLGVNLDQKNPNKKNKFQYQSPHKVIQSIWERENEIIQLVNTIKDSL
ncbi:MAG: N-6 DNA methylase, partial [Bacteroidota bacterium]